MKRLIFYIAAVVVFGFISSPSSFGATVSCEVSEVSGSTIILKNCDEKRAEDFKKGDKVKVKLQKKED